MRLASLSAAIVTISFLLGACEKPATPAGTDPAQSAPVAGANGQAAKTGNVSNLWNNGESKALDIQSAHPNGVVLQLTSLGTQASSTTVGLRVINGRERDVEMNRWNNRQGYILLDTSEKLFMSPPASNTKLSIPAGQTFEGELVFLGRLPPVKSAVLVINENADTSNEYTSQPGFRIDLPLGQAAPVTAQ